MPIVEEMPNPEEPNGSIWVMFGSSCLLQFVSACYGALQPDGSWLPPCMTGFLLLMTVIAWRSCRVKDRSEDPSGTANDRSERPVPQSHAQQP